MNEDKNWNKVKEIMQNFAGDTIDLGPYYSHMFLKDIKHVVFTLTRYKFASNLLKYRQKVSVLELGCQEAFGGLVFEQNTNLEKYVGIDFDHDAMEWNRKNFSDKYVFIEDNFLNCQDIEGQTFDMVLSLDVIEHISREYEDAFCKLAYDHVQEDGMVVIGTPTVYMSPYASEGSKAGHINLYDQERLYNLMNKYFKNVLVFNMNDEIVNTGFAPMTCYMIVICSGKKGLRGDQL